ncbi:hypothetical protein AB595_04815 [Massilia sp. WF1]|nr:hypothetical protein AM586_12725 [Massilia sp. WG5]KLU37942.1 hypothetical protein AB595_04815 [Massilia sp. WF1]
MNRDHLPCRACAKFVPKPGHCTGFDRPAEATDRPCVLFTEQGAWETRKGQRAPERRKHETISRASAPKG